MFPQPGRPRDAFERVEDAAEVHRHTGVCPSVALHIPWDLVEDWDALAAHAGGLGLRLGAINPNLFQDEEYRLGSVCHPDPAVRRRAVAHLVECVRIAEAVGSDDLSVWLADGTNYPGQDSFSERRRRLLDALGEAYAAMPPTMRMLVEYKLYEPAFYHTDIADWGDALLVCQDLGERPRCSSTWATTPRASTSSGSWRPSSTSGGWAGSISTTASTATTTSSSGSVNPLELFLIYSELARHPAASRVAYMIDQSHNVEHKIEAMIVSVANLQEAYAKALIVDRDALAAAQAREDVVGAHEVVMDAFRTDVRPLCARVRGQLEASPDPLAAFRDSGYAERVVAARGA